MTPSLLSNHSSWCQTSSWNTIQTSHFIPSQPYENKQEEMNEPLLLMEYHVYRTEHVAFLISYWKMHFKSAFTISIGCSVQEVMNRHLTITLSALLNICLPRLTIYYKVVYKSLKVSKFTAGSEQMTHLCSSQALACSQTPGWCRLGPRPRYSLPSPCLLVVWTNAFSTTWCWGERLVLSTEFGHPLIGQAPPLGGVDTSEWQGPCTQGQRWGLLWLTVRTSSQGTAPLWSGMALVLMIVVLNQSCCFFHRRRQTLS